MLEIELAGKEIVSICGNECPKGDKYAQDEIKNPLRILTSTVLAKGLSIKMVPIRTDQPIPKDRLLPAMAEIKKLRICKPVRNGDIIAEKFLGLNVNIIATRDALKR